MTNGKGNKTTFIKEASIYVCNDCGAYAGKEKEIKHHATCKPGESEKWGEIYSEIVEEEKEFDQDWNRIVKE